jgi:hypothetical protein
MKGGQFTRRTGCQAVTKITWMVCIEHLHSRIQTIGEYSCLPERSGDPEIAARLIIKQSTSLAFMRRATKELKRQA